MGTHAAFAFDVAAALVLWAWKRLVSIPAASITVLIQRDRVSREICLWGFIKLMKSFVLSPLRGLLLLRYSFIWLTTHNVLSVG